MRSALSRWVKAVAAGLAAEASLALALFVGLALRLHQIGEQLLLEDEWHTLHAVASYSYSYLLTHLGRLDYCIPFSLLFKLLADTTGLSEIGIRAPVLIVGSGTIVMLALLLRPFVGRHAANAAAWLLAVSPLHVHFSRYARPYAVSLFLTAAATLAFLTWWQTRERRWKIAYALCAALAPYFHLTALPLVLLPIGCGLAESLWVARRGQVIRIPARELLLLALGIVLALALLIGVPLAIDQAAFGKKAGRGDITAGMFLGAAELFAGSARRWVWTTSAAGMALGASVLARRQPRLLILFLAQTLVALVTVLVVRPVLIDWAMVFARYCLIGLPLLLIALGQGLASMEGALARRLRAPGGILAPLVALALIPLGPLPRINARPNNWTNHGIYQYTYGGASIPWRCAEQVSPFYESLAQKPRGSIRILEAPWWYYGTLNTPFPCSQRKHRQQVAIGFVSVPGGPMTDGGLPRPGELPILSPARNFHLRNFIHVFDHAELRRSGIRYVVFHKAIEKEMAFGLPQYAVDVSRWIRHYRLIYGPPSYEDEGLTVFDVRLAKPGRWSRLPDLTGDTAPAEP
jgi:hypothetical protein